MFHRFSCSLGARTGWRRLLLVVFLALAALPPHTAIAQPAGPPVVGWGDNGDGQLNIPTGLRDVKSIVAGDNHSLALKRDGTVVGWGSNNKGQINIPAGLTDVTAIAAGGLHSLALKSDGTVIAWGDNSSGEGGVPPGLSNVTAIDAGSAHNLALKSDGTVAAWGYNGSGELNIPNGLSNVIAIAAGNSHSLALKSDGTVVAWGDNQYGQASVPNGLSNVIAIAAGAAHSLALKRDGTVVAWGDSFYGQLGIPAGLSHVTAIAAGAYHNLALKSDGTVVAWGFDIIGQATVPGGLSNVTAITAGFYYSLALKSDGTIATGWGDNSTLQLNIPTGLANVLAVDGSLGHSLALKNDGTVVAWGWNSGGQSTVPAELSNVVAVAAGDYHSLALKSDGTAVAWGANNEGQSTVPQGLSNVAAIAVGSMHNLALKSDGTVVAWGANNEGQSSVPVGLSNVRAVAAGSYHSLALKSDGTVVAWGSNGGGQADVPAGLSNVVAIAGGSSHSLALKSDGTVVAWGSNSVGQLNIPDGLSNVIAIAAGGSHSLALKSDGTVVAWGSNLFGQASVPNGLSNVTAIAAGGRHSLALASAVAPTVTTQPSDQTVNAGSTASFSAAANGLPALTVQWQASSDGGSTWNDIQGATSATLNFTAAAGDHDNQYRAVFTNSEGSATSDAATLTVNFAPTVTTQPSDQTVTAGSTASFSAAADGVPAPTVQWQASSDNGSTWTDIAGATNTTLTFTAQAADHGKQYQAVFTNSLGSAASNAASLTVNTAPAVTTQPSDEAVNAGGTASFNAAASGRPAPTVQWQVSNDNGGTWSDLAGETSATLSFTAQAADHGKQFRAVFTNVTGATPSNAASLTVNFAPAITTQPSVQTVNAGSTASFSAAADGQPTPTVQWQVSSDNGSTWSDIAGETSGTLSFTAAAADHGKQYRAVFTNSLGSTSSSAATLTVNTAPAITTQPSDQTVNAGSTASFTAAAGGFPSPTVQWQVSTDGGSTWNDLAGETSTTLSVTAQAADHGKQFRAVFSNVAGSTPSNAASLTVNVAPTVTTQPSNQTVTAGSTVTFTAAASGQPTPTVKWQVSMDGGSTWLDLAGQTSATFSFTAQTAQNGNRFRAVFTNSLDSVASNAAILTVNAPPTPTATPPATATATAMPTAMPTAGPTGTPAPTSTPAATPTARPGSTPTPTPASYLYLPELQK